MSAVCAVELSNDDKMRLLSRRPSPRLLAIPLLLIAFFSLFGLSDWIDWSPNKNCSIKTTRNLTADRHVVQRAVDWRTASDAAYARLINEPPLTQSGTCRSLSASRADIDTMDVYPTLNFQVGVKEKISYRFGAQR